MNALAKDVAEYRVALDAQLDRCEIEVTKEPNGMFCAVDYAIYDGPDGTLAQGWDGSIDGALDELSEITGKPRCNCQKHRVQA